MNGVSSPAALTVTGTGGGALTLSGGNSYTGGTTITSGAITADSTSALGSGTLDIASNATLNLNTQDVTTGGLTGSGTVDSCATPALLTVEPSDIANFSGTLENGSGSLAFAMSGSGTEILSGAGSNYNFSGGEAVGVPASSGGGTLEVSSAAELGGGPLSLYNGTLDVIPAASFAWTPAISLCYSGATIEVDSNTLTLSGVVSGNCSLAKTGSGTLTLSGINTYNGTTISDGTLKAGSANAERRRDRRL